MRRAAGNGVSCCRDEEPKSSRETANTHKDRKSQIENGEIARKSGLFAIDDDMSGLGRLGGGHTRARTWDPMIKSNRAGRPPCSLPKIVRPGAVRGQKKWPVHNPNVSV